MPNPSAVVAAQVLIAKDVVRRLHADNQFMLEAKDHSKNIVGKTVEVPQIGTTKLIINGTTVSLTPIATADQVQSYSIDEYQTLPTKISFTEELLRSYDTRQEYMSEHEKVFKNGFAERMLHNWCPTHTLLTTGATKSTKKGTGTRKKVTLEDINRLNEYLTDQNVPLAGRCIVVTSAIHTDLLAIEQFTSLNYIKEGAPVQSGLVGMISGFKVYLRSRTVLKEIAVNAAEGNHNAKLWLEDNSENERAVGDTATETLIAWHPDYVSTGLNSNTLVSVIPAHGGVSISMTAVGGGSKLSKTGIGVVSMCETVVTAPAA